MKKQFYLFGLLFFPFFIQAQNVGIGTTTPTEKLEVKNPLRSTLKISSNSTADTTELLLSNKTVNGFGTFYTDFSIKSIKEDGLFFSSRSDLPANNSANSLVIRPQGNVGIGTNLPVYRFQVNENIAANAYMNITNTTTGSSGTDGLLMGLTGNAATLTNLENGSLQLGTNNLTRVMIDATGNVGIGNLFPTFKFDVSGDINTTGLIRLNSSPGGVGQVLTSNGSSADPTWVTPGLTHYVGELFGGGIIVAVWKIAGVEHGLIVSLTDLSLSGIPWSNPSAAGPPYAIDVMDGQTNTNAIIAKAFHTNSAAQLCNDYSSGGFTDWYLPSTWELKQCFNAAFVVNTLVGPANSLHFYQAYWSSTETGYPSYLAAFVEKGYDNTTTDSKDASNAVRAVRKF